MFPVEHLNILFRFSLTKRPARRKIKPSMGNSAIKLHLSRPFPPAELCSMEGLVEPDRFVPAPSLSEWISDCFLNEDGPLFTEEHLHLEQAGIGCLWTTAENTRHGRRIVGQAEIAENAGGTSGKWKKARAMQQIREWFGSIPDFVITVDAVYASNVDDISFAALIDHELCHCAQQEDEFGMPKFNKVTGAPLWCIRGHDVEEFSSVVRRFGVEAAGQEAVDFVLAAAQKPEIAPVKIARACGTCALRAA